MEHRPAMNQSMLLLLLAMLAFVGLHLGLALPAVRAGLIARFGAGPFRGLFALQAVVMLVLVVLAYRGAGYLALWTVPALTWLPILVLPVALWLVVGAASTRNPTGFATDGQPAPERDALPLYTAITRHPMMWGILLWALAHLAANGDLASVILFGGFAILTSAGMLGIDAKKRADPGFDFAGFADRTSLVPLAATLAGRNRLAPTWGDAVRLVVAAVLYIGFLHGHLWLFGVSPYPL